MDFTATDAAELTGISRRSVTYIYGRLRHKIARRSERETPLAVTFEVDASYFGPRRMPGKRGRGASGKSIVFAFSNDRAKCTPRLLLMPEKTRCRLLFAEKSGQPVSSTAMAGAGYDGLVDVGYNKHYRVNHSQDEFADGSRHINDLNTAIISFFLSSSLRKAVLL